MNDLLKQDTIYEGNCLYILQQWKEQQVDMCITSPPYWGLRNYKTKGQIWGGDPQCAHEWQEKELQGLGNPRCKKSSVVDQGEREDGDKFASQICPKCGAWQGELGQEPTPDLYIEHLVMIFREVKRVLKDEGTCWVNLGDTYGPNKSLIGIPFMFAMAMIQDKWILRNTLIWYKPNCMPSSASDRFTIDFEYLFFFSKNEHYYFEQQFEVAETQPWSQNSAFSGVQAVNNPRAHGKQKSFFEYNGMGIKEYAENGVQNPSDVKRRILAGQQKQLFPRFGGNKRAGGNNPTYSGKEWSPTILEYEVISHDKQADELGCSPSSGLRVKNKPQYMIRRNKRCVWTIPTQPHPEAHFATYPEELIRTPIKAGCSSKGIVLDPFFGSGTTGLVCQQEHRHWVGCELNPEYVQIAKKKLHLDYQRLI